MRILALIPARAGSKGIPRKNIVKLGDRPLIGWTIAAAREAGCFDRVVVSTDDAEIAEVARAEGAEVPFMRPAEFSGDTASALAVVVHALGHFADIGEVADAVAYLQPTSPFRTPRHLSEAYRQFVDERPDTLVSVMPVPHNMSASSVMRLAGQVSEGRDVLWLETPHGQVMRRQEKETLFARNGPAILIVSASDAVGRSRLYGERVIGYAMDPLSSLDIDHPLDLEMARALVPLAMDIASRDR